MDPRRLADANSTGRRLLQSGHRRRASRLLGRLLDAYNPDTAAHDEELVTAAHLWCVATDDARVTVGWIRYVHAARLAKLGATDPDTLTAGDMLAEALLDSDDRSAVEVLVAQLIALAEHPARHRAATIRVRKELARTLHHFGSCGEAIRQGTRAWNEARQHDPAGYQILGTGKSLITMLAACGRAAEADDVRAQLNIALEHTDGVLSELHNRLLTPAIRNVSLVHGDRCAARMNQILDNTQPAKPVRWSAHGTN
jgi:hypothetical protein